MKFVQKLIFSSLFLGMCGLVYGQTQSFRCSFSDGFSTEFKSNKPSSSRDKKFDDLTFDQLDTNKGTGRLIGNSGVSNFQVLNGDNSIHIVERTMSGNMNITTIFNTSQNVTGNFPVVHSRHNNLMSNPLPSQYVGFCKKLNQ